MIKPKERIYRDYQEDLIERLKDPAEALSYLRAALADEDERIFLLALRDVLQAKGADVNAEDDLGLSPT